MLRPGATLVHVSAGGGGGWRPNRSGHRHQKFALVRSPSRPQVLVLTFAATRTEMPTDVPLYLLWFLGPPPGCLMFFLWSLGPLPGCLTFFMWSSGPLPGCLTFFLWSSGPLPGRLTFFMWSSGPPPGCLTFFLWSSGPPSGCLTIFFLAFFCLSINELAHVAVVVARAAAGAAPAVGFRSMPHPPSALEGGWADARLNGWADG